MHDRRLFFPPEAGEAARAEIEQVLDRLTDGRGVADAVRLLEVFNWAMGAYAFRELRVVLATTAAADPRPLVDGVIDTLKRAERSGFLPRRPTATSEDPERVLARRIPADGLPLVISLPAVQVEFVEDLAIRLSAVSGGGVRVGPSDVISGCISAAMGIIGQAKRDMGGRLNVYQVLEVLGRFADLGARPLSEMRTE